MSGVTIWHNPKCSKSRQALALLQERGISPRVVAYLVDPPSVDALKAVLKMLDVPAIAMMRRREKRFQELHLAQDTPEADLIAAMAENPILIERPIVIANGRAVIGRPTEKVAEIL